MSPPWSKPLDIDRLADGEADIDFAVPLAELPRLRSQLASVEGMVRGRVHFTRESGLVVAEFDAERCSNSRVSALSAGDDRVGWTARCAWR